MTDDLKLARNIRGSFALGLLVLTAVWPLTGCASRSRALDEPTASESSAVCTPAFSTWVYPSMKSKDLVYVPDPEGDRITDYSRVGWKGGSLGLPSSYGTAGPPHGSEPPLDNSAALWAPWSTSVPPTTGAAPSTICNQQTYNHGPRIQAELNRVGALYAQDGVLRRVYLPRGHYALHETLTVPDGITLRGVSEDPNGTAPPTLLHMCEGAGQTVKLGDAWQAPTLGSPINILDDNVPSGGNCVRLPRGHQLAKGMPILITRLPCDNPGDNPAAACPRYGQWVSDIGMSDKWPTDTLVNQTWESTVTSVQSAEKGAGHLSNDSLVCFYPPITNALEGKYGPHIVQSLAAPRRHKNMAVFRLRAVDHFNDYDSCAKPNCPDGKDTCPCPRNLIWVGYSEDVWISEVAAAGYSGSAVKVGHLSRNVTVENSDFINPLGPSDGQYRYPFFNSSGYNNLYAHNHADWVRHAFMVGGDASGPNVFWSSSAEHNDQDSGSHNYWSTGALYDNIDLVSIGDPKHSFAGQFGAQDSGVGHGWQGSSLVLFNSHAIGGTSYWNPIVNASTYTPGAVAAPGSGQNWLIGTTGGFIRSPTVENHETVPLLDNYASTAPTCTARLITSGRDGTSPLPAEIGSSIYGASDNYYRVKPGSDPGIDVRTYVVGDPDDFSPEATDDVNDSVFVNPAFQTWISAQPGAATSFAGFDYTLNANGNSDPQNVPFSIRYDLAPGEEVKFAYLAVRMMKVGSWTRDADHYIQIAGVGTNIIPFGGYSDPLANPHTYFWRCTDSSVPAGCQALPAYLTGPIGWSTSAGSTPDPVSRVRVIELPASDFSPLLNRVAAVNGRRYGELNVNFGTKTRLDWVSLTLVITRPIWRQ